MLLFDTQPLIVDKHLAAKIGLNEAMILQQVHYWIEKNKKANRNFHQGKHWTYNTIEEWQEEFPFWSKDTVRRTFKKLRESKIIIVDNFNKSQIDKTLWYTIDYKTLEDTVGEEQIAIIDSSNLPQAIPENTTENTTEIYNQSVIPSTPSIIKRQYKTDIETEYQNIIDKCELRSIDEKYSSAVAFAIKLLLLDIEKSNTVKIGQHNYPSKTIRKDLNKLNFFIIEHAVNKFKQASEFYEIKNVIQYLKSCIYNAIHEVDIELDARLRNAGYY